MVSTAENDSFYLKEHFLVQDWLLVELGSQYSVSGNILALKNCLALKNLFLKCNRDLHNGKSSQMLIPLL